MATSPAPDAAKLRSIVQAGSPVLRQVRALQLTRSFAAHPLHSAFRPLSPLLCRPARWLGLRLGDLLAPLPAAQPAKTVPRELLGSGWLRGLAEEMTDVMRAAPGVGLAAPQIGEPWRVGGVDDKEGGRWAVR